MLTIEFVRVVCYAVNGISSLLLSGYFFREYMVKRLRASLAWGTGFFLFLIAVITIYYVTAVEAAKPVLYFGFIFSAFLVSLLYYGTSLLFFSEGSFFREKMTAIYWVVVIIIGVTLTYSAPSDRLIEYTRLPGMAVFVFGYALIGFLFSRVSVRLPKGDLRRRTTILVSLAWFIIAGWNLGIGIFTGGKNPIVEAFIFLFGSVGFLLLLYGMTTGKTTRR